MENEYYQLGAKLKFHDFAVSSTVSFECICDLNDRLVGIDKYSSQPHLYTNTLTTGIKIEHSVDVYMHNRRRKKRAFLFAVVMEYTRYFWIRWLKMVVCFFLLTVRFGLFLNAPIYFVRDKVMLFRHICDFFLFFVQTRLSQFPLYEFFLVKLGWCMGAVFFLTDSQNSLGIEKKDELKKSIGLMAVWSVMMVLQFLWMIISYCNNNSEWTGSSVSVRLLILF